MGSSTPPLTEIAQNLFYFSDYFTDCFSALATQTCPEERPFAFNGSCYDHDIRRIHTNVTTSAAEEFFL